MKGVHTTIDALLSDIYTALGFTDDQSQKAKSDIDALIKTRVVDSLVADLEDDVVQTVRAQSQTLTLGALEGQLAGALMATCSQEQVAHTIQSVTDSVVGEYLDFMQTQLSAIERQKLLVALSLAA